MTILECGASRLSPICHNCYRCCCSTAHVATVDVSGRVWLLGCEGTGIIVVSMLLAMLIKKRREAGEAVVGDDCADEIYFGWGRRVSSYSRM